MSATLGCQRNQTACGRGRLHVLYITAGLLLLTIFISSRLWSSNAGHLSARQNQLHQFSRQAATEVKLPYHKTPEQCYYRANRTHTVVVTILLPHKPGNVKVIASDSLERLLQSTPADVVLFHTGWSQLDVEKHIRKSVSFPFEARCIANVDWSTGHEAGSWEAVETGYHGAGYRSMCRWYARRVFNAFHHMRYEWVIRLDSDSEVPAPIPYNIIQQMLHHKAQYGFRVLERDHPRVVHALAEATRYWIVSQRLNLHSMWILELFTNRSQGLDAISSENYDLRVVYNNFFVSNINWWMQPSVQGWLEYLENLGGYYKFRWGDAPVHTFTAALHLKRAQMLWFDFDYKHG